MSVFGGFVRVLFNSDEIIKIATLWDRVVFDKIAANLLFCHLRVVNVNLRALCEQMLCDIYARCFTRVTSNFKFFNLIL